MKGGGRLGTYPPRAAGNPVGDAIGMEDVREHLDPIEDTRARASEVAARVDREDVTSFHRRERPPARVAQEGAPLLRGVVEVCAARR